METNGEEGWIDLHCHILPGLDDGPAELSEALAMARMAVRDGTRILAATPHITPGVHDNEPEEIIRAVENFRQKLEEAGIPLTLHAAADIRLMPRIFRWEREGRLPLLGGEGGARYFLLELPHDELGAGSLYFVERMVMRGLTPIITHPERNAAIARRPERLRPFLELGALSQVTAGSLAGEYGRGARWVGLELLRRGWVHLLASDGHGFYRRHPVLSHGVAAAADVVGATKARALATVNPRAVLAGERRAW